MVLQGDEAMAKKNNKPGLFFLTCLLFSPSAWVGRNGCQAQVYSEKAFIIN